MDKRQILDTILDYKAMLREALAQQEEKEVIDYIGSELDRINRAVGRKCQKTA